MRKEIIDKLENLVKAYSGDLRNEPLSEEDLEFLSEVLFLLENRRFPRVRNMEGRSGNEVPNQFIIETADGTYFQSYNSLIVFVPREGKTILDERYWDYSTTTGKYRNIFLGEDKSQTKKRILSGEYVLGNLNSR